MSKRTRSMLRNIRRFVFIVLCEISGKVCTYADAISRFGARAEEWTADRRDRP